MSVDESLPADGCEWATLPMAELRAFIEANRWIYARTMPRHPHEYVLLWDADSERAFYRFGMTIRRFGYDEMFFSKSIRYLDVDGRRYWTMGAQLAATWVLNRAENTGPDRPWALSPQHFVPKYWKPTERDPWPPQLGSIMTDGSIDLVP